MPLPPATRTTQKTRSLQCLAPKAKFAPRIFGTSPGTYGAGVEDLLSRGEWGVREEIGRAYLDATSHAYGGAEGEAISAPGAFEGRIAEADLLVPTGGDPGRDIL